MDRLDRLRRASFVRQPVPVPRLGYAAEDLSSLRAWDISPTTPESWPIARAETKQHVSHVFLAELRTRSGGVMPAHFQVKLITLGGEEYWLCRGHDLREHHSVPERSDPGREPFPLEPTADAILVLDNGHVVDCTCRDAELFGCPCRQIIEELEAMLRESDRTACILHGHNFTFGWQSQRPGGSRFNIECTVSRIEIEGNVRLIAIAVDATARRKSDRTLAQLSGRLLQMQDEERRRIARELHDTTGQNLGALNINLSMLLATAGLDPHAREMLVECIALTEASVREIRTMSYLLHPPLLDELGLVSALRAYAEGYAERTGLEVELDLPAAMDRLPQAIEIALFRIVQEGLANIHRHSGSRRAILRLKREAGRIEMEVIDFGRGLPPGTLESALTSAFRIGVGIAGMRERARQLGGRLTIGSSENGVTLHVVLPAASSHPQQLDTPI